MEEKSCGAVIFRSGSGGGRDGGNGTKRKYLLLKYGWGHWGFVKGHVEKGEECMQTAKREAEEEAGLAEGWLRFLPGFGERIDYFYTMGGEKMHKEVTYFLAECLLPANGEVKLSGEHTDYAWLSRDNAMKTLTYGNDRKVLGRAEKFLEEFLNKK